MGPVVDIVWEGTTARRFLSDVASHYGLTITFESCAYQLRRSSGRVVRVLSDARCLSRIAAEGVESDEIALPERQMHTQRSGRRSTRSIEEVYDPKPPAIGEPATASSAIKIAATTGGIPEEWRAPGMGRVRLPARRLAEDGQPDSS